MATMTYVPSRIGEGFFIDVPIPGSGDDDKALTYDHGTGEFVYTAFDPAGTAAAAVAAHVAAGDPHTQYELESNNTAAAILTKVLTVDGVGSGLDADLLDGNSSAAFLRTSGADTGASSSRQVFTNGITAPNWQPASDSTTALQMRTASGAGFVFGDTINKIFKIAANNSIGIDTNVYPTIYSDINEIRLYANTTNNVFRGLDGWTSTWADEANTTYFQTGLSDGNTAFSALFGSVYGRVAFLANCVQLASDTAGIPVPTALLDLAASTTTRASLRIRSGTAPASPNAGDLWFDGTNLKFYDGSATRTITWT